MDFEEVWGAGWRQYKDNFGTLSKLNLLFVILPLIIVGAVGIIVFLSILSSGALDYASLGQDQVSKTGNAFTGMAIGGPPTSISLLGNLGALAIPIIILGILAVLASLFAFLGTIAPALKKAKFGFREALIEGRQHYWRFLGLCIIHAIIFIAIYFICILVIGAIVTPSLISANPVAALGLLFILVIIAFFFGMYFVVKLSLSPYILIDRKVGVGTAIASSWRLTRGSWWRIFGYLILFGLMYVAVGIIFGVILLAVVFPMAMNGVFSGDLSSMLTTILVIGGIIYFVEYLVIYLFVIPLSLLVFKNLYLDIKNKQRIK